MTGAIRVTERLAGFVVDPPDLPDPVRHAGRRTIANAMGLAAGAGRHPAVTIAVDTARALALPELAGVLGRDERLSLEWAALANGVGAHVEDYDDTHLATVIHPGAAVVPAALSVGEWADAGGEDVLTATVLGIEVALRVGLGMSPSHFDRGWHITGTCGHLGAAAAAGRLLGLRADQLTSALSLAATQASGLLAAHGTMTKPLHPGKAAANGVEAALLVESGFTAPAEGIEGRRGLMNLASSNPDLDVVCDRLGDRWEVLENTFKPYACGIVAHPAIDAAITLGSRVDPGSLQTTVVRVNPVVLDVMGVRQPENGLRSKFSAHHAVAVGLLDAAGGPAQFSDERATADTVRALRGRITVTPDAGVRRDEAHLAARDHHGVWHEEHVAHATGSRDRPLTDDELRHKVVDVATSTLGAPGAVGLWETAMSCDDGPTCRELVAAARPEHR